VYDEDLKNLEEWIRRLKIEFDIFFAGNRKKIPEELRMRVEKLVKRLAEAGDMGFSQRFLYNTLIARYYVYKDLWRRTLQQYESAEGAPHESAPAALQAQDDTQAKEPLREIQVSISDPLAETDHVRRLYEGLLRMRANCARELSGISYQQFTEYITTQTRGIKKRYQCPSVTFRIAVEDKNIKFTARADNRPSG
jgi:hypothetical protein